MWLSEELSNRSHLESDPIPGVTFIDDPSTYEDEDAFVGHVSGMHDRMEILDAVAAALNFPDYFGRNWSALLDCLCDFHWVEQQRIVLVHDELPRVKTEDMLTYLAIVKTSIAAWIEWTTHPADHLLGGIASHTLGVVVGKKEEHEFRKLFKLAR